LRGSNHEVGPAASAFLLAAVAFRFGDERDAGRLRELAGMMSPPETERLIANASYHELEPMLHLVADDCSNSGNHLGLPPGLLSGWARAYTREMARTTIIQFGAERALNVLADAGIRAIPLKGAYLASRFYARKGARAYRDLDLLVEPARLKDLNEALLEAGFRPAPDRPSFVPAPAYTVYSLPLEGGDAAMEIDIHIGMHWPEEYGRRTCFNSGDLWSHAAREDLDGIPIWGLCTEHLVITTLLDLAINHRYARLIKFRDVLEITRAARVDWDKVGDWCRRWGVCSFVGPGLGYLEELVPDVLIPPGVVGSILPSYATMRMFLRALPAASLPDHRSRSFSLANLLFFFLSDTPRQRVRGIFTIPRHISRGRHRF
jgi:hypothetical protein